MRQPPIPQTFLEEVPFIVKAIPNLLNNDGFEIALKYSLIVLGLLRWVIEGVYLFANYFGEEDIRLHEYSSLSEIRLCTIIMFIPLRFLQICCDCAVVSLNSVYRTILYF